MSNRLRALLTSFSPAESAALLRALSDLESGSPRQWLLLEIAATLGPAQPSRRIQVLAWIADKVGIAPLLPVLDYLHLPGIGLYRHPATILGRCARQALDDAALLLVAFSALLAGFDRLPASRQFVACLLLLLGGAIKYWRVRKQHPDDADTPPIEETLPGAEAALGLQGLLLARGNSPAESLQLLAELRTVPDKALPRLTTALPELLPPPPVRREYTRAALACWVLAILPALWLNGWQWGWILTVLWVAGLAWIAHRRKTFVALTIGLALFSFGFARIAHLI
ncbi:hypothetical protein SAMN05660284_00836 [Formivibrio citricus]|uniref:Uncharacterized protein n=1 Tax=Formivibrio citricus TaxID=83765 RepID=A0A1I4X130_9NEIS|nr:hypothetical protein [Formivibrio citricus]SFN19322.1 hypothetical protein SAMN05660284_00836 [Formivibrio citricus]